MEFGWHRMSPNGGFVATGDAWDAVGTAPLLDERRRATRHRVRLPVQLSNLEEIFRAWTVDVSRSGALFRIDNPRFFRDGDGDPLLALTRQVEAHFERCLTVVFGGGILRRRMRVVRTTRGDDGGVPLFACAFHRPLTGPECELLGIETEGDEEWN
jgi:hypothetical protein